MTDPLAFMGLILIFFTTTRKFYDYLNFSLIGEMGPRGFTGPRGFPGPPGNNGVSSEILLCNSAFMINMFRQRLQEMKVRLVVKEIRDLLVNLVHLASQVSLMIIHDN